MSRKGQTVTLDGVCDKTGWLIVVDVLKRFEHRIHAMAAEIGHQHVQRIVIVAVEQCLDASDIADVFEQVLAPGGAAFECENGVQTVRAIINPLAQRIAAQRFERAL